MLNVLLQADDETAVRGLVDNPAVREFATTAGCHAFLIKDGVITELIPKAEAPNDHNRRAS